MKIQTTATDQGSRREKILEGKKLGQMECAGALRPRDGLPEHFGI